MDNELLAHQDKFEEVDSDGTKEENMRYIRTVVVALFFSLTVLLFCPSSGLSQGKEIIAEGTYNMGDGETPSVAESRAVL